MKQCPKGQRCAEVISVLTHATFKNIGSSTNPNYVADTITDEKGITTTYSYNAKGEQLSSSASDGTRMSFTQAAGQTLISSCQGPGCGGANFTANPDGSRTQEIGRASCRERVCQYV